MNNELLIAVVGLLVILMNGFFNYMNQRKVTAKVVEVEQKVEEKAVVHSQKLDKVAADINGRITQLISSIASEEFQKGIIAGTENEQKRVAADKILEARASAILKEKKEDENANKL